MYLGDLGPPPRKTCMTGGTCPSLTFSLGEVKLFAIFYLGGKNLPFGGVILSFGRNLLLLRGTTLSPDPHLGNLPSALSLGKIGLFAFFLGKVTFPTTLSLSSPYPRLGEDRGLNMGLGLLHLLFGHWWAYFNKQICNAPKIPWIFYNKIYYIFRV